MTQRNNSYSLPFYSLHDSYYSSAYRADNYVNGEDLQIPNDQQQTGSGLTPFCFNSTQRIGFIPMQLADSERDKSQSVFFESFSKYISLKRYKEASIFSLNKSKEESKQNQQNEQLKKGLTILKWLESLSLEDKSIILTTIDKKLVSLLLAMYKIYQDHGNVIFNNVDYPRDDVNQVFRVKKPKLTNSNVPKLLKQVQEAEDNLIQAVRIININEDDDSFTLDAELYCNTHFFVNIMKIISSSTFIYKELPLSKDPAKLNHSVIANHLSTDTQPQKPYYTFVPNDTRKENFYDFTLGQCLCFLIEKAINVQYYDYFNKLNQQAINQFFMEPKLNVFSQIENLTKFWMKLSVEQRNSIFMKINDIENELNKSDHLNTMTKIQEEESSDTDSEYSNTGRRRSFDIENQRPYYDYDDENEENKNYFRQWQSYRHYTQYGPLTIPPSCQKNDLFNSNNNRLGILKSKLIASGRGATNEEGCYKYITGISNFKSFDVMSRKRNLQIPFQNQFFDLIVKKHEQSIYEDLFNYDSKKSIKPPVQNANEQNQENQLAPTNAKKNKKKKKKSKQNAKDQQQTIEQKPQQIKKDENQIDRQDNFIVENFDKHITSIAEQIKSIQRFKEERTSLLTGVVILDKYKNDDMTTSCSINSIQPTNQKRKKNKNNKKKKKQKATAEINQPQPEIENQPVEIEMQVLNLAQEDICQKIQEDDIESINLEQIGIEIIENKIEVEIRQNSEQDKKINNFLCSINVDTLNDSQNDQQIQIYEVNNLKSQKEQDIEEEEATKEVVQQVASNLLNKVIFSIEDYQTSSPINQISKNEKQKKKKYRKGKKDNFNSLNSNHLYSSPKLNSEQKLPESELINQDLNGDNQNEQKSHSEPSSNQRLNKNKRVDFRIQQSPDNDEEVKVPKKGSSRGSSGTEEVHHNYTINMLGELFPQEYKNPSDTTKSIISEITKDRSESPEPAKQPLYRPKGKDQNQVSQHHEYKKLQQPNNTNITRQYGRYTKTYEEQKQNFIQSSRFESQNQDEVKPKYSQKPKKKKLLSNFDNYDQMFQESFQKLSINQDDSKIVVPNSIEVPKINEQKKPQNKKKKKRNLQEKGISVNPDAIRNANKNILKKKIQHQQPSTIERSQTPNESLNAPLEPFINNPNKQNNQRQKHNFAKQVSNQNQQTEELLIFDQLNQQNFAQQMYANQNSQTSPPFQGDNPLQFNNFAMNFPISQYSNQPQLIYPYNYGVSPLDLQMNMYNYNSMQQFLQPEQQFQPLEQHDVQVMQEANSQFLNYSQNPPIMMNQFSNINIFLPPSNMMIPFPYQQNFSDQSHLMQNVPNYGTSNTNANIPSNQQQQNQKYRQVNKRTNNNHQHQQHQANQNNYNYPYRQRQQQQRIDPFQQQNIYQNKIYVQIEKEILQITSDIKTKLANTNMERRYALEFITSIVKETYQDCDVRVQMYGSMETGVAIDSSDLDLLVSGVFNTLNFVDRSQLILQMSKLHKQLNSLSCLKSNSLIETATVPVIKIELNLKKIRQEKGLQDVKKISKNMKYLKIDITFDDKGSDQYKNAGAQPIHMGLKCCEFIKQKLQEYPYLEHLTLILKKYLAMSNLNSPWLGGLNSYGLILMIIALINYLQGEAYLQDETMHLGKLFYQFLFYYGKVFDSTQNMINENIMIQNYYNYNSILTILDPLNPSNNIGKSTYNFDQVKFAFSCAFDRLIAIFSQPFTIISQTNPIPENIVLKVLELPEYRFEETSDKQKDQICQDTE